MMSHVYAPGGVFQPICNTPPAKATTAPELSVELQHGRFRLPSKPIMTNCPAAASGAAGSRPLQAAAVKNTAHRIIFPAFITSGTIRAHVLQSEVFESKASSYLIPRQPAAASHSCCAA